MPLWMGVDINGWRDAAARDWDPEDETQTTMPTFIDGGIRAVSVQNINGKWVGGPQAILAPHGRGDGWGQVGDQVRRLPVLNLLDGLAGEQVDVIPPLRASFDALTRKSEHIMVTVPDVQEFDERAQGRLLDVLRGRGRARPILLWRSVALFQQGLVTGVIPEKQAGYKVNLLIHTQNGLELQTLTLAAASGFEGHYAPVRQGFGSIILPKLGLDELSLKTEKHVIAKNPFLAEGRSEKTRLPGRLLCEDINENISEILRRDNGTWVQVIAPRIKSDQLFETAFTPINPPSADLTLLTSPLSDSLTEALKNEVERYFKTVHVLPWSSIALGALKAGRLIERGLPHYLDQLEPISLAVMGRDTATFQYLIPPKSNVPANREFVSEPLNDFVWGLNRDRIEFFVLKGSKEVGEVRHWTTDQRAPPSSDMPVTIQLRQTPGQSWARLEITSSSWPDLARSPIRLDWDALAPDPRAPEEILEALKRPNPIIPARILEMPDFGFWDGSFFEPGLLSIMNEGASKRLLDALMRTQRATSIETDATLERIRPVSTDGELPPELSNQQKKSFFGLLQETSEKLSSAIRTGRPIQDNLDYRILTWTFAACPFEIQDFTLDALEAYNKGKFHPLLNLRSAQTVLQQGAGRSVDGQERINRLLNILSDRENKRSHTWACYSHILSRREIAPSALDSKLIHKIVGEIIPFLESAAREQRFNVIYKYLIGTTAGLLRFREVEPWALVTDRSADALILHDALVMCRNQLSKITQSIPQGSAKLAVTDSLIELLRGSGGDPDLLRRIDDLPEKD